jgi:hypothetical protein
VKAGREFTNASVTGMKQLWNGNASDPSEALNKISAVYALCWQKPIDAAGQYVSAISATQTELANALAAQANHVSENLGRCSRPTFRFVDPWIEHASSRIGKDRPIGYGAV